MKNIYKISVLIAALLLLIQQPAKSCDPNCDHLHHLLYGGGATLGTILLAPAIGTLLFDDSNPPYGKALGLTALTSIGAYSIGLAITSPTDDQVGGATLGLLAILPVVAGIVTTSAVFNKQNSRDDLGNISQPSKFNLGLQPISNGAAVTMVMTF